VSGKDEGRPMPMPDLTLAKEKVRAHHAQMIEKGGGGAGPRGFVETRTIDSTEWDDIVSVKGRGRLTALGVVGGQYDHRFRVTIDGREVADEVLASAGPSTLANNGLGVDLPFAEALHVEGRDEPEGSALAHYWVCWVLEQGHPAAETTRSILIGETEQQLTERRYEHEGETVATARASLGPRFVSEVQLFRDWAQFEPEGRSGVSLAGQVVVHDLAAEEGGGVLREAECTVRPAGRRSAVAEIGLAGGDEPDFYVPLPGRDRGDLARRLQSADLLHRAVSLAGEVLVAVGAALSALGALFGFVFSVDLTKRRDEIRRKAVDAWKAGGEEGREPTSAQALTAATKRQRAWRIPIVIILILAVLANIAALVFA
jgi:hypothetical protein